MSEDSLDKTSELYSALPFMEAFPFGEYEVALEVEGSGPEDLGVDPILIKNLGSFGTEQIINFKYEDEAGPIIISINQEDVLYLAEISRKIKKMTPIKVSIDLGLNSDSLEEKVDEIKRSRTFIKNLESEILLEPRFEGVLADIMEVNEVNLTSAQILAIQKRSLAKLKKTPFSEKQHKVAKIFLDFQLHYAKILLGIVIAAKIY